MYLITSIVHLLTGAVTEPLCAIIFLHTAAFADIFTQNANVLLLFLENLSYLQIIFLISDVGVVCSHQNLVWWV